MAVEVSPNSHESSGHSLCSLAQLNIQYQPCKDIIIIIMLHTERSSMYNVGMFMKQLHVHVHDMFNVASTCDGLHGVVTILIRTADYRQQ